MSLDELRVRIDQINHEMVDLFVERMKVSVDIAKYKAENNLPILDKGRERKILQEMEKCAGEPFEDYVTRNGYFLFAYDLYGDGFASRRISDILEKSL